MLQSLIRITQHSLIKDIPKYIKNIPNIYKYIHTKKYIYTQIYNIYTNIYKIYTKYQAATAQPGPEAPLAFSGKSRSSTKKMTALRASALTCSSARFSFCSSPPARRRSPSRPREANHSVLSASPLLSFP